MKVAIVGTGYVGLVTGTCFAESGNRVICVDIDERKVQDLRQGKMPIFEPGLDHILERNIKNGRLTFTTNLEEAVIASSVLFLCLPTPPGEDGSADLQYVLGVANDAAQIVKDNDIKDFKVFVNKSIRYVCSKYIQLSTLLTKNIVLLIINDLNLQLNGK